MKLIFSLVSGLLFGIGLIVSGMANPAKVLGFLDIAGNWDPSLAFVMAGAILVTLPGYRLLQRKSQPLFAEKFSWPTRKDLTTPLITGSALFGVGWGIAGFCPGPALVALSVSPDLAWVFVVFMIVGLKLDSIYAFLSSKPNQAAAN